jgi:cytochrome subunit of sulfide dehydrogenase
MTRATRLKAAILVRTSMILMPASLTAAAAMLFSITAAAAGSMEPPVGAAACSGCHPASSVAETSVPALAGRNAQEIVTQMRAFKSGQRDAIVMDRIAKGYSEAEIEAIANWYQAQR